MSTHRILIGSILKPVNDARMYEKIGTTLSNIPESEIHIAGFKSAFPTTLNYRFYAIYSSSRLSFKRFLSPWKFIKIALKVKPHTIIVSTHELLIVTCIYKILFGCRILYDVQENYLSNILYTNVFPPVIRQILGYWVRFKERRSASYIDGYLLAEKTYQEELKSFVHPPALILENKYNGIVPATEKIVKIRDTEKIKLLYSGTIAASYGVFEAVDLAIKLHLFHYRYELTIIGYAPNQQDLSRLINRIKPFPFIQLIGGSRPVPHTEILSAIQHHHIGLLPYRFNESTHLRVPTKLFEYLVNHLPVISSENPIWEEYIQSFQAGISIPFQQLPKAEELNARMINRDFYTEGNPTDLLWNNDVLLSWYKEHGFADAPDAPAKTGL